MSIELKDGNIHFNVYDLFDNMSDDQLNELADHYSWHDPAYKAIIRSLREEYAAKNYNDDLYQLRKNFFIMPVEPSYGGDYKEDIQDQMIQTMRNVLAELAKSKTEYYRLSNAKNAVYHYIFTRFGDDVAYEVSKLWTEKIKDESGSDLYDHTVGNMMADMVKYQDFVQQWVESMQKMFENEQNTEAE